MIGLIVLVGIKFSELSDNVNKQLDNLGQKVDDTAENANSILNKVQEKDGILDKTEELIENYKNLSDNVEHSLDSFTKLSNALTKK